MGLRIHRAYASICTLFAVIAAGLIFIPAAAAETLPDQTRLVLLGTGYPNPDPDRSGPSVAVIAGGKSYIVDFGPGLVRRAQAARRLHNLPSLDAPNLDTGFVTHLHSDHTAGFPDILLIPWVMEREVPLKVFGPPGITAMSEHLIMAYKEDIANRIKGAQPNTDIGWQVEAKDVREGLVYEDENVKVEAFEVCHGYWDVALGYRFTTADRVIVISGDTTYCPNLVKWAANADILLHEVYGQRAFEELPEEWQRYHKDAHTAAPDLARIALATKPKLLVLYHQLYWFGSTDEEILAEIARTYKGPTVAGRDLDIF